MEQFTYSESYLKRKGVTPHDVAFVIASTLTREFDLPDSRRSNPRVMLIGFTPDGELIEIGLEQLPNGYHLFHVRKPASKTYRSKYASR